MAGSGRDDLGEFGGRLKVHAIAAIATVVLAYIAYNFVWPSPTDNPVIVTVLTLLLASATYLLTFKVAYDAFADRSDDGAL